MRYIVLLLLFTGCAQGVVVDSTPDESFTVKPVPHVTNDNDDWTPPSAYDGCVPQIFHFNPNDPITYPSDNQFVTEGGCPAIVYEPPIWIPPFDPRPVEKK